MRPWQDEQHVDIAAPADMVYRYLADLSSQLAWSEAVERIDPPADGAFVVGAAFGLLDATGARREARVTALQAPMRIAWEASSDRALEEWEFLVLPSAAATTLGLRLTLTPRKAWLWLVRDQWRTKDLAAQNLVSLAMIKAILETSLRDEDS